MKNITRSNLGLSQHNASGSTHSHNVGTAPGDPPQQTASTGLEYIYELRKDNALKRAFTQRNRAFLYSDSSERRINLGVDTHQSSMRLDGSNNFACIVRIKVNKESV